MSATWRDFGRVVVGTWPAVAWETEALASYVAEVQARGLTPEQAIAAVRSSESQFVVAAGALAAGAQRLEGHPEAEEAWALIEQAVRRIGRSVYAVDFAEHHQAAVDWLAERDVAVALWAAQRGLCGRGALGQEPVHDDAIGGAVRHRLHGEYRDVRARVEQREALGRVVERRELSVRSTAANAGGMAELLSRLRPEEGPRELERGEA